MAPHSVILDTDPLVRQLRFASVGIEALEGCFFVTDLIEDLFTCFHNAKTARAQLKAFVAEIESGKFEYGYTLIDRRLANIVERLGECILDQLVRMNMYMPDGNLPYYYVAINDLHFNDILLRRLYDLPDFTTTPRASKG